MKNIKPSGLVKYLEKKAQAAEKKATKKKATKKKATKKKATKTKKKATKKKATKKKATKKKATKKKVTGLWPISKSCTWCNQGKWHYGIATQQACQHKAIAVKAR